MNAVVHPFIFELCLSLDLRRISCKLRIVESCAFVHSAICFFLLQSLIHLHAMQLQVKWNRHFVHFTVWFYLFHNFLVAHFLNYAFLLCLEFVLCVKNLNFFFLSLGVFSTATLLVVSMATFNILEFWHSDLNLYQINFLTYKKSPLLCIQLNAFQLLMSQKYIVYLCPPKHNVIILVKALLCWIV